MRLIDADELEREYRFSYADNSHITEDANRIHNQEHEHVLHMLKNAPTIEAEPVRHGHWEVAIGYDQRRKFQCSECRKMAFENSGYCPFCGAKMTEVKE